MHGIVLSTVSQLDRVRGKAYGQLQLVDECTITMT